MKFLLDLFIKKKHVERYDINQRFDLIGRVGQGSMSKVWRARDLLSGKVITLKVLDRAKTRRFEDRFPPGMEKPTEGEIALGLKHPYIVRTHEIGWTTNDEQFLIMDFIEGISLNFLVEVQNEAIQKNRLRFMVQLGEAIRYIHNHNWIHRDICPRNVLVDRNSNIKLIDFGLVVPNTPNFQQPGNRTGTIAYMAPELLKRHKTDQRLDIFSFAVTCFETYTRRHPWNSGDTMEQIRQRINTPPLEITDLVKDIDYEVANTIMRGLDPRPDYRWQTIDDMLEPLRDASFRLEGHKLEEIVELDDDEYDMVQPF